MNSKVARDFIIRSLQEEREAGKFCDLRLYVGKRYVCIHSAIICALSPFISKECCIDGMTPLLGNYKQFSFNSPLDIGLLKKDLFECFECLQYVVDVIYGRDSVLDLHHTSHVNTLCELLQFSDMFAEYVCNTITFDKNEENEITNDIELKTEPCNEEEDEKLARIKRVKSVAKNIPNIIRKKTDKRTKILNFRTRFVVSDFKTLSGKMHSCMRCAYKCYKPGDLLTHLRETNHDENCCSLCLTRFDSRENLKNHYDLHDNPKPFFCTICDARFQTKSLLSLHLPRHSKETPFTCSFCKKGFKWKHGLNSHLMLHSNEKKHLCDECGFSTMHAKTLRAHKLTHTGELFRCSFPGCTHTCSRKENMKIHLFTHNNDKPFVCEICGNKFSLNKSLKRHALMHSAVGFSNVCPHCPFKALRADNLKAHILRQHSEKQLNLEINENFGDNITNVNCGSVNKKTEESKPSENMTSFRIENDLVVLADAASSCAKIQEMALESIQEIQLCFTNELKHSHDSIDDSNTKLIIEIPNTNL